MLIIKLGCLRQRAAVDVAKVDYLLVVVTKVLVFIYYYHVMRVPVIDVSAVLFLFLGFLILTIFVVFFRTLMLILITLIGEQVLAII